MAKRMSQLVCLLLLTSAGCKGMFGPQGMPAEPLFPNGQPAESKAQFGPAVAPPFAEPTPPVNRTQVAHH